MVVVVTTARLPSPPHGRGVSLYPPPPPSASSLSSSCSSLSDEEHSRSLLQLLHSYDLTTIKTVHARMLRLDIASHRLFSNRLLKTIIFSLNINNNTEEEGEDRQRQSYHLAYAVNVFDQIPEPNLYSWNILIRAYSSENPSYALFLFSRLLALHNTADKFTFPFAIKAAAASRQSRIGRTIHGMVHKQHNILRSDVFILNSLIHFYASCGDLQSSRRVFTFMPDRDVVSWNSIINSLSNAGCCDEAFDLFREMLLCVDEEGSKLKPNDVTMLGVLSACGQKGDLEFGRWIHSYIRTNLNEIEQNLLILHNAVLDMYVKCGSLRDAEDLFEAMPVKDSFSWTTMLVGHAKSGDLDTARRTFDAMPSRGGIVSWNAMMSAYEQGDRPMEALDLFREAFHAGVKPDDVTFVVALSACSELGALDMGCWIHTYILRNMSKKKKNLKINHHLTTSLIDMYCKCGELEMAVEVFQSVENGNRDVFVWSAMIAGMAMHGRGKAALDLFRCMTETVVPNAVTFTNILSACSHAGMVKEGKFYFSQMLPVYGIEPKTEHYASMVDILGRAGRLQEAVDLIKQMPSEVTIAGHSVFVALLGSCVVHGNVEIGEYAFRRLLELQQSSSTSNNDNDGGGGGYVLMSNLYAKTSRWDGVAMVRKLMRERGLKKERGCSWIEVHGVTNEFLAGDTRHPQSEKIYSKLEEMMRRLREDFGYRPDPTQVLQCVDEEEVDLKEKALYLHSEKLAMAFGLLITANRSSDVIRITKNLRICEDCHLVAKLVSMVYGREILVRDRYRFHRFKDGRCSCIDYW